MGGLAEWLDSARYPYDKVNANAYALSLALSLPQLNSLLSPTAAVPIAAAVLAVALLAVALTLKRELEPGKSGLEGLKDALRVYIPGRYPLQVLEDHRDDFKKAGILQPEKLLRNVSIASSLTAISLAAVAFLLGFLEPSIPVSIQNPIPAALRPYVYAISTYAMLPFLFAFFFTLYLNGKISSRRENIDLNLHSLYITLLGFAKAGLPVKDAVKEIMTLDLGEISREFARIYYAVRYGNTTLKAAMLDVAATTPSSKLAELLRGIVGVMEAGGDLGRYMEERIESMEVERKIIYTEYLKKLEMIAEVYLTVSLAIPTMVVSIQLAKSIAGQADFSMVYGLVYGFMPLTSVTLVLVVYALSPEKGVERPGIRLLAIIPASALIGILLGILSLLHIIPGNIEFWTLSITAIGSTISALLLRRKIKEDEMLSSQLPQYFNRVLSLAEAEKDTTTAFKLAAGDTGEPLSRYVRVFAEMLDKGVPRGRAFNWLFNATPSSDLKLASKILSKTVDVSGKVTQVLLSLVGELLRLNAFRKEKDSLAKTYGSVMALAALMFLGIASAISVMLLGQFEKMGQTAMAGNIGGSIGGFTISPVVIDQARQILRHASYIVSTSAAVGIAATRGDFRRLASPLAILLSTTLVAGMLFMNLHP